MNIAAWRTIVIEQPSELSYTQGTLEINQPDFRMQIPLFDVQSILIVSLRTRITSYLINELCKRQISVVFCDESSKPSGQFVGYHGSTGVPNRLREQIQWKKQTCQEVWNGIVTQKIKMQRMVLNRLGIVYDKIVWNGYETADAADNQSIREGQAARLYFHALFGNAFNRCENSAINSALNYGYAILCSAISRTLVAHGLSPSVGIAHRSATNAFNLSCDLLEPFRPFVDYQIYRHPSLELNKDFKRELIELTNTSIQYGTKRTSMSNAMDGLVLDVIRSLKTNTITLNEIGL